MTGYLLRAGGPHPMAHGHLEYEHVGGTITVFTTAGKPVTHTTIGHGQAFHFTLPTGQYRLNAGTRTFDKSYGCQAVSATVHAKQSTHINVDAGCSIP